MIYKAYPFCLYPNKDQQALIHQTHGHCRFVYNHLLEFWQSKTTSHRKKVAKQEFDGDF